MGTKLRLKINPHSYKWTFPPVIVGYNILGAENGKDWCPKYKTHLTDEDPGPSSSKNRPPNAMNISCFGDASPSDKPIILLICPKTWGRGWMTKASGVGERRKGRGELRRDCHHRVAALFVPTRMQQWYMIYMGEGAGGGPFAWKITWCPWGAPEYLLKQEDSSELTLPFVIMPTIANNDEM